MDNVQQGAQAVLREDGTVDIQATALAALEATLNALMDEQASELAGALGVSRNGYRERSLDTCVGRLVLRVPKLRQGSYFPDDIVERWCRTDTALASTFVEMWAKGVSTGKADAVAREMGLEGMSRSRLSRLASGLDVEVDEMRSGGLSGLFRYLWLDATYVPVRDGGRVRREALVTAVACSEDGVRRFVGLEVVDSESYLSWRSFLLSLRARGLSGVELVVSDAHLGLARAVSEVFCGCTWQRCVAHLSRNVADRCGTKKAGRAAVAALKAAFAESEPSLVEAGYDRAVELLARVDARGAELLEEARPAALAYLDFPREHARWVRTNNVQERANLEIKRRTRVVQVFPSPEALARLAGAVCCDLNDEWADGRNFIAARTLRDPCAGRGERGAAQEDELARVLSLVDVAFERARAA